jgi:hypothetical protein
MKRIILLLTLLFTVAVFAQSSTDSINKLPACPVCRSHKDVVPIVYGKPATETIKKAERGECWLGGCVVDKDSPRYYCKKDKKSF